MVFAALTPSPDHRTPQSWPISPKTPFSTYVLCRGPKYASPNMPHWQKSSFEMGANENQQIQKNTFLELPLSD